MSSENVRITPTRLMQRETKLKPTAWQVMGERSSGTNYVYHLLKQALTIEPSADLGWKHGFPQMRTINDRLLIVCVYRNAHDWALSMHKRPWHTTKQMQGLSFSSFIRAEWDTCVDRPHQFGLREDSPEAGLSLQLDRHPLTGQRPADLWELRGLKLQALTSMKLRAPQVILTQFESVLEAPEAFVAEIRETYKVKGPKVFEVGTRRFGSGFRPLLEERPETPAEMSAEDLTFMLSRLDGAQESELGYTYIPPRAALLYRGG